MSLVPSKDENKICAGKIKTRAVGFYFLVFYDRDETRFLIGRKLKTLAGIM